MFIGATLGKLHEGTKRFILARIGATYIKLLSYTLMYQ